MKLVSLHIFKWVDDAPILLSYDLFLEDKSFFVRGQLQEELTFNARLVAGRTPPGVRSSIQLATADRDICYAWTTVDRLSACAICNKEYPSETAFLMLNKLMLVFREQFESIDQY
jgi:hypothetical protein